MEIPSFRQIDLTLLNDMPKEAIMKLFDRKDRKLLRLPDLQNIDLTKRDFLGWKDSSTSRGYIIAFYQGELIGIQLESTGKVSNPHARICDLCLTVHPSNGVTLYSAANKVDPRHVFGIYICDDLACSLYVRHLKVPRLTQAVYNLDKGKRIDNLNKKLNEFLDRLFITPE